MTTQEHTRRKDFNPAEYRVEAIEDQHGEVGWLGIENEALIEGRPGRGFNGGDVPTDAFAEEMAATEYRCAHCGRRSNMRYIGFVRYIPTGQLMIFGSRCTREAFANSRLELNEAQLGKAAEIRRKRFEWEEANPEQAAALDIYEEEVAADASTYDEFLNSLSKGRRLYGALTEAQTPWPLTAMVTRQERIERAAEREAKLAETPDLVEGRYEVEGRVVSLKTVEGYMPGSTELKMLVETDEGNRVFGTVPAALYDGEELKDRRVAFTAKVQRSDKDRTFGFFSRPTKARFTEEER